MFAKFANLKYITNLKYIINLNQSWFKQYMFIVDVLAVV